MSGANQGIGLVLTSPNLVWTIVLASAVGTFILGFLGIAYKMRNEIVIARRANLWSKLTFGALFILSIIELQADLSYPPPFFFRFPMFGVTRPLTGIVCSFLGLFVAMHPFYRWFALLTLPFLVTGQVLAGSSRGIKIACLLSSKCVVGLDPPLDQLTLLSRVNYAGAFAGVWAFLLTWYLAVALGWCTPRYPTRLLAIARFCQKTGLDSQGKKR